MRTACRLRVGVPGKGFVGTIIGIKAGVILAGGLGFFVCSSERVISTTFSCSGTYGSLEEADWDAWIVLSESSCERFGSSSSDSPDEDTMTARVVARFFVTRGAGGVSASVVLSETTMGCVR